MLVEELKRRPLSSLRTLQVHSSSISAFHPCVYLPLPPVRAPVPRAEQRKAGEPRGERQAEDDQ